MARTKGSKNRSTMVKELADRGHGPKQLAKLSNDDIKKLYSSLLVQDSSPVQESQPEPPKVVEIPRPTKTSEWDYIYEETERRIASMSEWYGYEDIIPDRIVNTLVGIKYSTSKVEALKVARKTLEKTHTMLLSLWANNKIGGPPTPENLQKRIENAEYWVSRNEQEGNEKQAERQRQRVAALRSIKAVNSSPTWF